MSKPDIIRDPRPDLTYDSRDWAALLTLVTAWDRNVGGILHGFRCGGLRLHRVAGGYALAPDYGPTSIWPDRAAYERDRNMWLRPHGQMIVAGLRALHEVNAS